MRDCRQRVPVFRMNMGKRPANIGEAEAAGYPGILIDVTRIIVVNEIVSECLTKDAPCKNCQTDANAGRDPAAAWFAESA